MDKELFELCKELYEATGLEDTNLNSQQYNGVTLSSGAVGYVPRYTSDYLLEKLPPLLEQDHSLDNKVHLLTLHPADGGRWIAYYHHSAFLEEADTALKALLKLTLALAEAGQLTNKEN